MTQTYQKILSLFDEQTQNNLILQTFYQTDIGKLYSSIPIKSIANNIPSPKHEVSGLGRTPWFTVEGGIGLMILKSYLGLSDSMLINRINTDGSLQLFCGIDLKSKKIKDKNIVSDWRVYLGKYIDIKQLQQEVVKAWKPYMNETHVCMADATVYESYVCYPTDIKLLWGSVEFIYERIVEQCKIHKVRKPRIKYTRQQEHYLSYQRRRKKSKRNEKRMRKKLVRFIGRLLERLEDIIGAEGASKLIKKHQDKLKTIRALFYQQKQRIEHPEKPIENRVVSLHKPYMRPIVRGKEVKPVEFGAKVHVMQVDGINFIEHISYNAYNESTRLRSTIWMHRDLFGKCSQFAGDKIYATNKNRSYCTKNNIATCFVDKGKSSANQQQKKLLRSHLGRQRATVLEGSFGNEKNHYGLRKIKAKTQATEQLWILFGMLTANAVKIMKRKHKLEKLQVAA